MIDSVQSVILDIPGWFLLFTQIVLILSAAVGASISFFSECVNSSGRLTGSGKIAASVLSISIVFQFLGAAIEHYQTEHKEAKNIERLLDISRGIANNTTNILDTQNSVRVAQGKIGKISEETQELSVNAIHSLQGVIATRSRIDELHVLVKDSKHLTDSISLKVNTAFDKYLSDDGLEVVINDDLPKNLNLKFSSIKLLKSFHDQPELVKLLQVSVNGIVTSISIDRAIIGAGSELTLSDKQHIALSRSDVVKVWLETRVQRDRYFGEGSVYFERRFSPITLDLSSNAALFHFDYIGGDELDSQYRLDYEID